MCCPGAGTGPPGCGAWTPGPVSGPWSTRSRWGASPWTPTGCWPGTWRAMCTPGIWQTAWTPPVDQRTSASGPTTPWTRTSTARFRKYDSIDYCVTKEVFRTRRRMYTLSTWRRRPWSRWRGARAGSSSATSGTMTPSTPSSWRALLPNWDLEDYKTLHLFLAQPIIYLTKCWILKNRPKWLLTASQIFYKPVSRFNIKSKVPKGQIEIGAKHLHLRNWYWLWTQACSYKLQVGLYHLFFFQCIHKVYSVFECDPSLAGRPEAGLAMLAPTRDPVISGITQFPTKCNSGKLGLATKQGFYF